jgi:competence protein ComFB
MICSIDNFAFFFLFTKYGELSYNSLINTGLYGPKGNGSMEKLTKNDTGELVLVNIVEDMVKRKVNELIKDADMCDCMRCRLNACAIALNNLPSHYVTTEKGALLGELDDVEINYQTNLMVETMKALLIVKENPLH